MYLPYDNMNSMFGRSSGNPYEVQIPNLFQEQAQGQLEQQKIQQGQQEQQLNLIKLQMAKQQMQDMQDTKEGMGAFQTGGDTWNAFMKKHPELAPGIMTQAASDAKSKLGAVQDFYKMHPDYADANANVDKLKQFDPTFTGWKSPEEFQADKDDLEDNKIKLDGISGSIMQEADLRARGLFKEADDMKSAREKELDLMKAKTDNQEASADKATAAATHIRDLPKGFKLLSKSVMESSVMPIINNYYPNLPDADKAAMASDVGNFALSKMQPGTSMAQLVEQEMPKMGTFIKDGGYFSPDTLDLDAAAKSRVVEQATQTSSGVPSTVVINSKTYPVIMQNGSPFIKDDDGKLKAITIKKPNG